MLCDAQGVILHSRRSANVSKHDHMDGPACFPRGLLSFVLFVPCEVVAIVVNDQSGVVLVGIVLRWQCDQEQREYGGQNHSNGQNKLKIRLEALDRALAEHVAGRGRALAV